MSNIKIQTLAHQADAYADKEWPLRPRCEKWKLCRDERFATLYRDAFIAELLAGSWEPVAYIAWGDGKPAWSEDCVCEDAVYPRDDSDDASTSMPIHSADQIAAAVLREREKSKALLEAVQFYAERDHFNISNTDAWDTVSGEPQNYWCDDAGTATVEDGSVARAAIAQYKGEQA